MSLLSKNNNKCKEMKQDIPVTGSAMDSLLEGVGKTTLLLSAHFCRIFIAIKWKNSGK
jgi:hypothetical protein